MQRRLAQLLFFVKVTTDDGVVGWSEFDEGTRIAGHRHRDHAARAARRRQSVMNHERIREELFCVTRPGQGGVVGQALGAIENALLDAKAKTLGVPCYDLLGGKIRDRMRVYWSHCVTWRAARTPHYRRRSRRPTACGRSRAKFASAASPA